MDTKEQILDVAQALVQTIGAKAMSYQHISEAVGIRKASIHHHFPTKEKLLDALIVRYSAYFFSVVDDIIASKGTGLGKLRQYFRLFETTLRTRGEAKACPMGMLGAGVRTLGEGPAEQIKKFYTENDKHLAAILEEGRGDDSLHFDGSSLAMAGLVFALLEGGMLIARGRGSVDHFRAITDQLLRLMKP